MSICKGSTREGASFFAGRRPQGHLLAALCEGGEVGIAPYEMTCRAGRRPQGHLLAALCERGDVGIAPYEMTCRAGPMCPAAKDTFSPAGHAGPALQGARVLGGQSRLPLQTGRRGRRPLQREALSLRGAKRRGNPFSPCLPLRGRWQREALTEGELSYGFSLPQSAAPTAPSQRGPCRAAAPR